MRKTRRRFLVATGAMLTIAGCQDGGGPTPDGTPGAADDLGEENSTPAPAEDTPMEEGAGETETETATEEETDTATE
jgi:hypothetical protein